MTSQPMKDTQTVNPDGEPIARIIDGVTIRRHQPVEDLRGEVVEIYRPSWDLHPDPLVYIYQATIRPGRIKGWTMHKLQDDRIAVMRGTTRWVLFDNRPDSPTYRLLNDFTFSERNRVLLIIPRGVYHAVENVGDTEALFINMPTRPYNHTDPDKYRLPLENDIIPSVFKEIRGW